MVTDPQSVEDLDGCVADGRGGYEDLARAIMDGRTCVPVGAGLLMLMGNLEDAARAIQPDDDDDPIVPMPDDLGLVESHPDRRVQCVIVLRR
jgi:hypothetical protein